MNKSVKFGGGTISVIIPVYNAEKYLSRCLNSVINNTYQDLEIICVNDGSTDESLSILNKYAKEDSRIIVINQNNSGVSSARNQGLKAVSSDSQYISFMDSDDQIDENYYACLMHDMLNTDADIVCSNYKFCREDLTEISPDEYRYRNERFTGKFLTNDELAKDILILGKNKYNCGMNMKLLKKSVLEGLSFNERYSYGEDTILVHQLLRRNCTLYLSGHKVFYYYIQHEDSAVNKVKKDTMAMEKYIKQYLDVDFIKMNTALSISDSKEVRREVVRYFICKKYEDLCDIVRRNNKQLYEELSAEYIKQIVLLFDKNREYNSIRKASKSWLFLKIYCFSPDLFWDIKRIMKRNKV